MRMPGGLIPSGVGGGIFVGDMGVDLSSPGASNGYFDVATWMIQLLYINAECPHTGCWGGIARRAVAFDFRFSCDVPLDYDNIPEMLLNYPVSVSLRFNLGDVTLDQQLIAAKAKQKYYYAPSALIDASVPVLNAAGDVIRQRIMGSGNSVMFLLPNEQEGWSDYKQYMHSRGWLT